MRRCFFPACSLVFLMAMTVFAVAADPSFTREELERCVRDTPEFVSYMGDMGQSLSTLEEPSLAQAAAMPDGAAGWLADRGWDSERYGYVLEHVSRGFAALQVRKENPQAQAELAEAMNMPGMTEDMKAQIRAAMGELDKAEKAEGISDQEMRLVEEHFDELTAMYEAMP